MARAVYYDGGDTQSFALRQPACSAIIGPIVSQWAKALAAWAKSHPGQIPPPSLSTPPTPPNLTGACG